jgi:hypothetical protein
MGKCIECLNGYYLGFTDYKCSKARYCNIVENEKRYGDICDKLINILHAGYKTDIILDDDLKDIYVNTRNFHRFFNSKQHGFILKEGLKKYYRPTIREAKAKALFWRYLEHHIEELWD